MGEAFPAIEIWPLNIMQVIFLGGYTGSPDPTIDAFNASGSHVIANLAVPRKYPAAAGSGRYAFIAGGYNDVEGTTFASLSA